ncbi:hypothetical protein [Candidatus Liberibacter sp.]|uniref:hypothetical protein n=1 Tax=Candidatus Liberibacter sp. TaxID=34022 RepID=UPI0015F3D879|nr:hypothetical protein [Candidatus Liberibacter sp.]MBA5724562.1 hypothetical protein [Candidatus Liberibacter sp.]
MRLQEQKERLKKFQANDKNRQLRQVRAMVMEFKRMVGDLEKQISLEERQSGIYDTRHFAYSTFAKSARQRADNLFVSIRELLLQQEVLESDLEKIESENNSLSVLERCNKMKRIRA